MVRQAVVSEVKPFASHDPRTLFPSLPEAALEALGIDADEPRLACPLLGRDLPNPYYFLRHRGTACCTGPKLGLPGSRMAT